MDISLGIHIGRYVNVVLYLVYRVSEKSDVGIPLISKSTQYHLWVWILVFLWS